jgi:hypothetical protein
MIVASEISREDLWKIDGIDEGVLLDIHQVIPDKFIFERRM